MQSNMQFDDIIEYFHDRNIQILNKNVYTNRITINCVIIDILINYIEKSPKKDVK